jgi:hypothetical protein
MFPQRGHLKSLNYSLLDNIKEIGWVPLVKDEITFLEMVRLCGHRYLVELIFAQACKSRACLENFNIRCEITFQIAFLDPLQGYPISPFPCRNLSRSSKINSQE